MYCPSVVNFSCGVVAAYSSVVNLNCGVVASHSSVVNLYCGPVDSYASLVNLFCGVAYTKAFFCNNRTPGKTYTRNTPPLTYDGMRVKLRAGIPKPLPKASSNCRNRSFKRMETHRGLYTVGLWATLCLTNHASHNTMQVKGCAKQLLNGGAKPLNVLY